jgi:A/G-specific adenine glycosylase
MLQQTQVKTVVPYWERWMQALPDVASLATASDGRVLALWEGLGYYRRARNLQRAAREIMSRHNGVFPRVYNAILDLPGVGPYTAGAICSIAFNQPTPVLDGNVVRVLCRLRAIARPPRDAAVNRRLWDLARQLVDAAAASGRSRACSLLNQGLMELGATLCTPAAPACDVCPIEDLCRARALNRVEAFPKPQRRPPPVTRHFVVVVPRRAGRLWVRRRPEGGVNGGFWEFPNVEVASSKPDGAEVARGLFSVTGAQPRPLVRIHHAITRYRMIEHAFLLELPDRRSCDRAGRWCTPAQLVSLPLTTAHRRILKALHDGDVA